MVEISYDDGAEPYTGDGLAGADLWGLFDDNLGALFAGTGVTVSRPDGLGEMQALGDLGASDFTVDDLLALDDAHRQTADGGGTRVLHAIWVDGYYNDGERQTGVLGVSIGSTGVIAMFKPVIASVGATDVVRRFGEQTTLIHEVGHAVGLVNNGVSMVDDHQDAANGAHCDNDRCVMYRANEGVGDLAEFVGQVVTSGDTVIFDSACQADVQAGYP